MILIKTSFIHNRNRIPICDYFDGEPLGGKRFFVHKNQLMGVEVILLVEKVSENGPVIEEQSSYFFFYDEEQLIQAFDNKKQEMTKSNT